jgi:hypothetical protein
MRNTLILIGQIHTNQADGMDTYQAVVEATVQRARPVILTALAAVLAFVPLTFSVFWGSMAYTLIGGVAAGTVLTLVFLPRIVCDLVQGQAGEGGRSGVGGHTSSSSAYCRKALITARAPPTPIGGTKIGRSRPAEPNAASRPRQRSSEPIKQTASRKDGSTSTCTVAEQFS